MNIYIEIINKLSECNSFCFLGFAAVLCTLIICVTIIIYRLLMIFRDLIEDCVLSLSIKAADSKAADSTIYRSRYRRVLEILTILILFSFVAILLLIILFVLKQLA